MKILDADHYRVNVRDVIGFTKGKTEEERLAFIGMLAIATNVPIVITAIYVGELYGFTPELSAFIERLKVFYNVGDVVNTEYRPSLSL